jgi:hypothetical protein
MMNFLPFVLMSFLIPLVALFADDSPAINEAGG